MRLVVLSLLLLLLLLSGCYSVKIEREVAALDEVRHRQNFFMFGLIGDNHLNLTDECPRGVAAVRERFTPGDIVLSLLTVGIYTPRTVFINCAS